MEEIGEDNEIIADEVVECLDQAVMVAKKQWQDFINKVHE